MSIKSIAIRLALCILSGCSMANSPSAIRVSGVQSAALSSSNCVGLFSGLHPTLISNCTNCHSGAGPGRGAFANADLTTAYGEAKTRFDLIPRYAGMAHGNCPNCGPALGATVQTLAAPWAQAEASGSCSSSGSSSGGGSSGGPPPFDDNGGEGSPPPPSISEAGLNAFSGANGLHPLLKQNCVQCHVPGGIQAASDFAQSDVVRSYLAAYTRVSWSNVANSKIVNRASTPGHGQGCVICGDPAFVSQVTQALEVWKAAEASGGQTVTVSLSSQAIGLNPAAPSTIKTLQWDLGTSVVPADVNLNGAIFKMQAGFYKTGTNTYNTGVYALSLPQLTTANNSIEVRELRFIVNGVMASQYATFSLINAIVPSLTMNQTLQTGSALIPVSDTTTDTLGIVFTVLRKP